MLDRLWPVVRHGLLLFVPILLAWAASDLVPVLGDIDPRYSALATAVLALAALILTPLTRQYGVVGKEKGSDPQP